MPVNCQRKRRFICRRSVNSRLSSQRPTLAVTLQSLQELYRKRGIEKCLRWTCFAFQGLLLLTEQTFVNLVINNALISTYLLLSSCDLILQNLCTYDCVLFSDEIKTILDRCTNDILIRPDWERNMQLVDLVNTITNDLP